MLYVCRKGGSEEVWRVEHCTPFIKKKKEGVGQGPVMAIKSCGEPENALTQEEEDGEEKVMQTYKYT